MTSSRIDQLIDHFLTGVSTESETRDLDQLLITDRSARDRFIRATRLETLLYTKAISWDEGAEKSKLTLDARPVLQTTIALLIALAAMIAVSFFVANWVTPTAPTPIAELVETENASWESALPTLPGSDLQPGSMNLLSGIALIRFASGAKVTLEAPAIFELETPMKSRLLSGVAVIEVPESATGFVVDTPDGYAVDHGTEFSVSVDRRSKTSSFEVLEGEISVHADAFDPVNLKTSDAAEIVNGQLRTLDRRLDEERVARNDNTTRITTQGKCCSLIAIDQSEYLDADMLLVKLPSRDWRWERRSVLHFDVNSVEWDKVAGVQLKLNLVPSGMGYATRLPVTNSFDVFGVTLQEDLDWNDTVLWNDVPNPTQGELLGSFDVPRSLQTGSYGIESELLREFLMEHVGKPFVIVVTRRTTETETMGLVHAFASDSHPEASGPVLELELN